MQEQHSVAAEASILWSSSSVEFWRWKDRLLLWRKIQRSEKGIDSVVVIPVRTSSGTSWLGLIAWTLLLWSVKRSAKEVAHTKRYGTNDSIGRQNPGSQRVRGSIDVVVPIP